MRKLTSLLKAAMSQDMNLFKIDSKNKSPRRKLIAIAIILMFSVGSLAYELAWGLSQVNLTYLIIPIFIIITSIMTFIESIYKSQGILFEAKDNDLLFSLPITKANILFVRVFKMISFQVMYQSLFMVPAFAVYAILENPSLQYYCVAIITLLLLPILPTIFGSILGYMVKGISAKAKSKKLVQTITTMSLLIVLLYVSSNINQMMNSLVQNAESVSKAIEKIYYPAVIYVRLIQQFNLANFVLALGINIIPLFIFMVMFSGSYFKMISKLSEKGAKKRKIVKNIKDKEKRWKKKSALKALVIKEIKKFFSSPVFVTNAGFAMVIVLLGTIALCSNANSLMEKIIQVIEINTTVEQVMAIITKVFYGFIVFASCMTSITSSMISLEGKSINILKSAPIKEEKILFAKILASNIITVPVNILSSFLFFGKFKVNLIDVICILMASIIVPIFSALVGILMNLNYPKMDATSDTEVIKQSMSSFLSVTIGILVRRNINCSAILWNRK